MNDRRHVAALLGFAFVAAWIAFGFGDAVLCLVGAALFAGAVAVADGQLDLGELQGRLTNSDPTPSAGLRPPASGRARSRPRVR